MQNKKKSGRPKSGIEAKIKYTINLMPSTIKRLKEIAEKEKTSISNWVQAQVEKF